MYLLVSLKLLSQYIDRASDLRYWPALCVLKSTCHSPTNTNQCQHPRSTSVAGTSLCSSSCCHPWAHPKTSVAGARGSDTFNSGDLRNHCGWKERRKPNSRRPFHFLDYSTPSSVSKQWYNFSLLIIDSAVSQDPAYCYSLFFFFPFFLLSHWFLICKRNWLSASKSSPSFSCCRLL